MKDIPCFLKIASKKYTSHTAVIDGSRNISYKQLDHAVDATQQRLKAIDLSNGDHVAILSENSLDYLIILMALWRTKVITCLLSTRTPDEVIPKQLSELNSKFMISSAKFQLNDKEGHIKEFNLNELVKEKKIAGPKEEPKLTFDQGATMMFTSGSLTNPKAVIHSLGNHYYSALGSNENMPVNPSDRWLLSLPLYHVSGLSILFRSILGGGTIVIPQQEENFLTSIKNHAITHISLVTTQLFRLLQDDNNMKTLKRLNAILIGGSTIPPLLIQKAQRYQLPIFTTYGLTEMASQVATTKGTSKAKVLNYRQVKIANDNEILVKGETLFQGYWDHEKTIVPHAVDGWFKTGDIGSLDSEGYLTVTGRKDNMFISGGENIHPEEIEQQILSIEEIEQAIVVPERDEEFGFRPVAFIQIQNGKNLSTKDITTHLKKNLASFKSPQFFHPWPQHQDSDIKTDRQRFINLVEKNKKNHQKIT